MSRFMRSMQSMKGILVFKRLWQLLNRGVVLLPLLWTLVAIGYLMDGEPQNAVLGKRDRTVKRPWKLVRRLFKLRRFQEEKPDLLHQEMPHCAAMAPASRSKSS